MHPHDTPIRVDHVGIAVPSIDDTEPVLHALGCEQLLDETIDDRFRWAYYDLGDASRLELIEPVAPDSFLAEYLDRNGPGLHHVTLEVADIDRVIETLEAADLEIVEYAEYEGWTEAFISPRNPTGVLFQLMEYHDAYAANRSPPPAELFVNGSRLTTSD